MALYFRHRGWQMKKSTFTRSTGPDEMLIVSVQSDEKVTSVTHDGFEMTKVSFWTRFWNHHVLRRWYRLTGGGPSSGDGEANGKT